MKDTKETIHFILTGGTIDSYFEPTKDTAVPTEESIIPRFIKSMQLYVDTEFTTVCMKDSRNLSSDDLDNIVKNVNESPHKKIIITHGTYTMPDTARLLKANLKRDDQTIILTGSMIPINGFSPSDGPFSLGFCVAKIQDLSPGVYVCMNGRVFDGDEVFKFLQEGRFTSIFESRG